MKILIEKMFTNEIQNIRIIYDENLLTKVLKENFHMNMYHLKSKYTLAKNLRFTWKF